MQELFEPLLILSQIVFTVLSHSFLHPFSILMGMTACLFGYFILPILSRYFESETQSAYNQGLYDASIRKEPISSLFFHSTIEREAYLAGYNYVMNKYNEHDGS